MGLYALERAPLQTVQELLRYLRQLEIWAKRIQIRVQPQVRSGGTKSAVVSATSLALPRLFEMCCAGRYWPDGAEVEKSYDIPSRAVIGFRHA